MRPGLPALALLCLLGGTAQANPALQAGQQMFMGQQALAARVVGHQQALPPDASRCVNCHAAAGTPSGSASSFGPRLDSKQLLRAQARRGGPPSKYDMASLCRVLREGIDPTGIVLPPSMPRYTMDDAGCRAMWTFLTAQIQ